MVWEPDLCHFTSALSSWSFSFSFAKISFPIVGILLSCSDLYVLGITSFRYIVHVFRHLVLHSFEISLFLK